MHPLQQLNTNMFASRVMVWAGSACSPAPTPTAKPAVSYIVLLEQIWFSVWCFLVFVVFSRRKSLMSFCPRVRSWHNSVGKQLKCLRWVVAVYEPCYGLGSFSKPICVVGGRATGLHPAENIFPDFVRLTITGMWCRCTLYTSLHDHWCTIGWENETVLLSICVQALRRASLVVSEVRDAQFWWCSSAVSRYTLFYTIFFTLALSLWTDFS